MRNVTSAWVAMLAMTVMGTGIAEAENISGIIKTTKVIYENSQLVGNVTCTMTDSPCIDFGASHIKLRLNGFTMTGPGDPDNPVDFCNATSAGLQADGIRISDTAQARVLTRTQVLGPGMVQKFRRHGIFILGSVGEATKARVAQIVSHHNCFSGILFSAVSESIVEENVSVRNSSNSTFSPCGGNCLVNSHNNRIRRNHFAGNGSVINPSNPTDPNNDFGVGLVGNSSGNVIEENSIGGNTNGVLIQPNAANNVIRRNVIAGNPPSQVSRTFGAAIGFDVKDESLVPGAGVRNTFQGNLCVTYRGPGPAPCPNFPGPRRGEDNDGGEGEDDDN